MKAVLLLLLCSVLVSIPEILALPTHKSDDTGHKQELVGKIIDLIKREQLRQNLIEEEDTTIINETSVRDEVSKLIEINGIEDITEAVDSVSDAVKHEPIFSKAELSDFNLIREDVDALIAEEEDNTLEDLVADVYQALPTDLQLTIAEGYNTVMESYENITKTWKREWYNFQVETNALVDNLFGDGIPDHLQDEADEKVDVEESSISGVLRPGESTVTIFDVIAETVTDFFGNLWNGFWNSRMGYIRIYKRSLARKVNRREVVLPELGTAGEIVNDMARSLINTATLWKYK